MAEIVNIFTKEITPLEEAGLSVNEDFSYAVRQLTENANFIEFFIVATAENGDVVTSGSRELRNKDALWLLKMAESSLIS